MARRALSSASLVCVAIAMATGCSRDWDSFEMPPEDAGIDIVWEGRPLSCGSGLMCGEAGCCDTIYVPGGSFPMGCGAVEESSGYACMEQEQPEHTANVSAFFLDRFEVTVGRFRQFVNTFPLSITPGWGRNTSVGGDAGWNVAWNQFLPSSAVEFRERLASCSFATWTDDPEGQELLPINCVTWYEAYAFCAWDRGRLPTEAEWEFVAANGPEQRLFPWGAPPFTTDKAVWDCSFGGDSTVCDRSDIAPVGSKPLGKGARGHLDLTGSMWEWVADRYRPYDDDACDDCLVSDGETFMIRGGSWEMNLTYSARGRAVWRGLLPPDPGYERTVNAGFRCARNTD